MSLRRRLAALRAFVRRHWVWAVRVALALALGATLVWHVLA